MLAIGLMSGTSLDGIDAALVNVVPKGAGYAVELLNFQTYPYPDDLLDELRSVLPPYAGSTAAVAALHQGLGRVYARAARAVAGERRLDFVASHGQTLWHDGARGVTLQAGDAFAIREALDAAVCYDFRSADCAAGGQGAPLVAYVDALLLSSEEEDRVVVNLGGIANATFLRKGASPASARAFDTGPANMLLDAFVADRTGGAHAFDPGGAFAAAGRADERLLAAMLADAYFALPSPKTTGRERFGTPFLAAHAGALSSLSLEDGAATLVELTARSLAASVTGAGFAGARTILGGGGVRNPALVAAIAERLPGSRVESSDAMGIPPDAKEAMAFAVLGYETLRGRPANSPAATGARHAAVLGAIAPCRLTDLLAKVERECRAS